MAKRKRKTPKIVRRMVNPKDIQVPTRLLHSELSPEQSALSRYTYKHAGRFLYGNYEQWENGFLREPDPDTELLFWMRTAAILQHLSPETEAEAKEIIGEMVCGDPSKQQRVSDAWEQVKDDSERYVNEAFSEYEKRSE